MLHDSPWSFALPLRPPCVTCVANLTLRTRQNRLTLAITYMLRRFLPRPVAHLLWMTFGEGIADELPRRISSPSASVRTARSGSFGVACRPADIRTRHSSPSVVVKHCRRGKSAAEVPRPLPPFHHSTFPLFHFSTYLTFPNLKIT